MTTKPQGSTGAVVGGRTSIGRWARNVGWRHLVGWVALAFAMFPVLWVISASLNPVGTLTSQTWIPDTFTLDNYRALLFEEVPYTNWYLNTIMIAGGASLIMTFLSALAAYAFSRMRFRGRRTGLLSVLLIQMFPQTLAFVAIFPFTPFTGAACGVKRPALPSFVGMLNQDMRAGQHQAGGKTSARGTRITCEATQSWARRRWYSKPEDHSDDESYMWRVYEVKVTRLTLGDLLS